MEPWCIDNVCTGSAHANHNVLRFIVGDGYQYGWYRKSVIGVTIFRISTLDDTMFNDIVLTAFLIVVRSGLNLNRLRRVPVLWREGQ